MHTRGRWRGRMLFVLLDWLLSRILETVRSSSSNRGQFGRSWHSQKCGAVRRKRGMRLSSTCMLTSLCTCRRLTLEWQRGAGKRGWLQPATATMGHAGAQSACF